MTSYISLYFGFRICRSSFAARREPIYPKILYCNTSRPFVSTQRPLLSDRLLRPQRQSLGHCRQDRRLPLAQTLPAPPGRQRGTTGPGTAHAQPAPEATARGIRCETRVGRKFGSSSTGFRNPLLKEKISSTRGSRFRFRNISSRN